MGDPCDVATGNNYQHETDYSSGGLTPLVFERYYNSNANPSASTYGPEWPELGSNWRSNFDRVLTFTYADPNVAPLYNGQDLALVYRPDGKIVMFTISGNTYTPLDPDTVDTLTQAGSNQWQFTTADDTVETYAETYFGIELQSIQYRSGVIQTLTYNAGGFLEQVTDSFGRSLSFAYNDNQQLQTVTDPAGDVYSYAYNGNGYLSGVTYPDSTNRQYQYGDSAYPGALTAIIDESGQTYASWSYDDQGRVIFVQHAGGADSYSLSYDSGTRTTITEPLGGVKEYTYSVMFGVPKVTNTAEGGLTSLASYDADGWPAAHTDENGNVTLYTYDDTRGLEISRTEASGSPAARTITTQWSSTYHLPTLISVYAGGSASGTPIRTTSLGYDGSGNLLTKTTTDPATGTVRTWTYTYDSYGDLLTAEDPRSNLTQYTYYTCSTGSQCGELDTVTDALGGVTTYNSYDGNGKPLTIIDANGTLTTLTYDARGRLTSRNAGGQTTSFSYYPTGLLEQVTLPDGSSLSYTYDAAHRLTQASDGLGNRIVYTLDAMGNRTAENTYDPSGVLHRTHTRVIDTLNEVYQEVNAAGTSAVTTTFGYDNDGNPTSIRAPLSRTTSESYDALNRVSSISDPANGITAFSYDAEDDLTSVKDPRNLTTYYGYNGFGDLVSQVSPDTGTTTHSYDSAGNLATSTDARGALATYGYDALNRVTSIAYSVSGTTDQTLSFTYDQGTDGIGHLTGASDANHSMSFGYDALGEMTGMSQTAAGINRSIAYGYTKGDLTSVTTPSGQAVTYSYNAAHQITSIAVNGTTVLSNVSYEPFGPVDGWRWGNGNAFNRTFDGDGDITGIRSPGSQESLSYDDASRISGITNTASGSSSWTYGHDQLDHLTSAASSSVSHGWTYDGDGNRLSETGTSPSAYSILSSSNEIAGITGTLTRTYAYDAAGNTLGNSTDTDTYNDAGRLKTIANTSGTTTFIYNALGQMIEASNGSSGTTLYVYDQAGHLLGEYDGSGNLIQETVWLGDIPVATIRRNGASVAIYYVESDQLDIPRAVIRPSDNAQLWTWFSGPFGSEAPNTNPQGIGTFTYDLRFPGQIAGGWGGTFQNDNRDYDPQVGRYVESDPIGLGGASYSTYAYAHADPANQTDPLGLVPNPAEATCLDPLQPICWGGVLADIATWVAAGGAGAAAMVTPSSTDQSQSTAASRADCPPDHGGKPPTDCEKEQQLLEQGKQALQNWKFTGLTLPERVSQAAEFNEQVRELNLLIAFHNQKCPENQVTPLQAIPFSGKPD